MSTVADQVIVKLPLECRLTEAELKAASKELADALNKRAQADNQLETFKAQKKAEMAAFDATIAKNTVLVNSEKEFRLIECSVEYDFGRKNTKTFCRLDTGEVVKSEPITNEERQRLLPGLADKKGAQGE